MTVTQSLKKGIACCLCAIFLTPPALLAEEASPVPAAPLRLSGGVNLSPEAASMADELRLYELINQLEGLKRQSNGSAERTIEALFMRQELSDCRQKLLRAILKADLEADYVLAAIDGEHNEYAALLRDLCSSRDTAILINTIVTQLVNGVCWSLTGVFTFISVDHIQAANPDGIFSIIAGAVPAGLSLYALKQLQGPKRKLPRHPNMLAPLFSSVASEDGYYPESVLKYLDTAQAGDSKTETRKQALIDHWVKCKLISKNGSVPNDRRVGLMTGTIEKKRAMTIALLQDRQTMLNDVRASICQMKRGLVELMPLLEE